MKGSSTVHTHVGQKFNKLYLLEFHRIERLGYYYCLCDCGQKSMVRWNNIQSGVTKSCGCMFKNRLKKHGDSSNVVRVKEYRTWAAMKSRCNSKTNYNYDWYGGRGIKVCKRWNVYKNFLADMGRAPSPKHTIERIDVNGNYEPSNCKWATMQEQLNNRRNNRVITIDGVKKTVAQWARHKNISYNEMYYSHYDRKTKTLVN